ncbi:YigZ family protein [Clostridium bowmanii]|uniref:YigZ family protein n=1 Tax=Clostridium bowmanii TaxID=132925 RepID=UPI001C0BBD23|nr:YigZ family protein [Clostridium bowmanii]MBU3192129.1 YigZ family protein [Clostridium bowmanii]MCA1076407.1 YigZ family protein [Clostridium bowmanii]
MSCFTIKDEAKAEFKEKKSVFIGHGKRVETEEEAKEFIQMVKDEHKEARHNVYAYIIGEKRMIQRYSDDGEPHGTGGIPMLEVLKKSELTDVVVVVTRYFGGILLGTGGLARAYSKGASLAIKEAGVVEKVKGISLKIEIDYDLLGKLQYVCAEGNNHIENIDYTDKVKINILCEFNNLEKFESQITNVTSGKALFEEDEPKMYFKLEHRLYE